MSNRWMNHYLSVFFSLLSKLKARAHKYMAVLKIYIGNGFDVVPHCKHFQPTASLLATANKGRAHLKFPVERPVRRAFDLDWENS